MAHPEAVKLYRAYPYMICMDSTYKTNRYGYPLFQLIGVTPIKKSFTIAYVIMKDESIDSSHGGLRDVEDVVGGRFSTKSYYHRSRIRIDWHNQEDISTLCAFVMRMAHYRCRGNKSEKYL
ncbi:hypothetical protein LINPERPRIM_LOCUS37766 [Linum perenne]